jgi:hypothetical protein
VHHKEIEVLDQHAEPNKVKHMTVSWKLADVDEEPNLFHSHRHARSQIFRPYPYRTLLLNRVATKADMTTMETTILTAVETLLEVILDVCGCGGVPCGMMYEMPKVQNVCQGLVHQNRCFRNT